MKPEKILMTASLVLAAVLAKPFTTETQRKTEIRTCFCSLILSVPQCGKFFSFLLLSYHPE